MREDRRSMLDIIMSHQIRHDEKSFFWRSRERLIPINTNFEYYDGILFML